MSKGNIAGRDKEMRVLHDALHSGKPEFIAVYGRRRVGKTFLIREFFGSRICFELTGVYNATAKEQLINFGTSISDSFDIGVPLRIPDSWQDAFLLLRKMLESRKSRSRTVVFMDELPWLNTPRSGFLKHLEHFWNSFGSKHDNLVLVVCGSAALWMIQHIVESKGGLHNRLTAQIRLAPFTLSETKEYLGLRKIRNLDHYQILLLYMAFGGVPYYWSLIRRGRSAAQVIDDLIFSDNASLQNEYEQLLTSLFGNSNYHKKLIEGLAKKKRGLNRNGLLKILKLKSGGRATETIRELEVSGFIDSYIPFGKKTNDANYRLTDEFMLFHLYWIEPLGRRPPGNSSWINLQAGSKYNAWSGYCFENICLKHINEIKYDLRIDKIEATHSPWEYRPKENKETRGAQIDLLIDRRDMVINLCEMKFYRSEFTIDSAYARELRNKAGTFRSVTRTKKSIFLTLITTFGLKENSHSASLNIIEVKMDALFSEISY